jgi:hypothetical protein
MHVGQPNGSQRLFAHSSKLSLLLLLLFGAFSVHNGSPASGDVYRKKQKIASPMCVGVAARHTY